MIVGFIIPLEGFDVINIEFDCLYISTVLTSATIDGNDVRQTLSFIANPDSIGDMKIRSLLRLSMAVLLACCSSTVKGLR